MKRKSANLAAIISLLLITVFFLGGCATINKGNRLLPSSASQTVSGFSNYEEVKAAFDAVKEGETTVNDLEKMGLVGPNVDIKNFLEVRNYFLGSNPSYGLGDLPDGVQRCMEAKEKCQGYIVTLNFSHNEYVGSFWKNMFGFQKEMDVTGWNCQPYFVIVGDTVVYKLWSGKPEIKQHVKEKKPLGPLQDIGEKGLKKLADEIFD